MKLRYVTPNRLEVEIEGNTQVELFQQLASFQEIFDQFCCGSCKKKNVKFVVRTVDDNNFYEIQCLDCYSRLSFSQNKKGGSLYLKLKDKEGKWLPNGGWGKWDKDKQEMVYE